jgi:cysteine desulfurase / selenocysteine lyase
MIAGRQLIYLDNAATSWPKPAVVAEAMTDFINRVGANPGRSGHRLSIEAGRVINGARERVAELFGAGDPLRVAFGPNATAALNLALYGLLRPGDHVITSSVEHNSMMRPLRDLETRGTHVTVIPCDQTGMLDPAAVEAAILPSTKLIALTHASNVMGTMLPIAEIGALVGRRNLIFLVDSAATAGIVPIDMTEMGIDLLAFSGHKHLLGPMGTGGLVFGARIEPGQLTPLLRGGTGSRSDAEIQPTEMPDAFESGTPNASGLAGLSAAIDWIQAAGLDQLGEIHSRHISNLIRGLAAIPGLVLFGDRNPLLLTGSVAFTINSCDPGELGFRLDESHELMCRVGLHCAPAAHKTIGTFPTGAVRFSPGAFTTDEEIDMAVKAVAAASEEMLK